VPLRVAKPTGSNNVAKHIGTAITSRNKMLCSSLKKPGCLRCKPMLVRKFFYIAPPHGLTTIIAFAIL
jgi:hypothetical protein